MQVSSIGGITAFPNVGVYHASKWALEGFSQALAQEVAELRHPRHADRARRLRHRLGRLVVEALGAPPGVRRVRTSRSPRPRRARVGTPGDPTASAAAVLRVVDAEEPPLRVFFGTAPLDIAKADYESRIATWDSGSPWPSSRRADEAPGAASGRTGDAARRTVRRGTRG